MYKRGGFVVCEMNYYDVIIDRVRVKSPRNATTFWCRFSIYVGFLSNVL
jgi:hypothetical protein